jgi:hypothetical protein
MRTFAFSVYGILRSLLRVTYVPPTFAVPKAYKAPEFLEELQALLTEQGTVSLECKVVGVPTPVLRWYKDGQEIKAGDVFALTANPDDPTSLGTYTCEAVNCMGKAYSSSRVHVVGKGSREGSLRPADRSVTEMCVVLLTDENSSDLHVVDRRKYVSCQKHKYLSFHLCFLTGRHLLGA